MIRDVPAKSDNMFFLSCKESSQFCCLFVCFSGNPHSVPRGSMFREFSSSFLKAVVMLQCP